MSAKRRPPEKELPFEEALEGLEKLVGELEGGNLPLEDSLRTFEEGVRLVRVCSERLKAAELRIRQVEETQEGVTERSLEPDEE
jgi:exodeoxyribonuclease VII small subunit